MRQELAKSPRFDDYAGFIADLYNLDVTAEEAKRLLIEEHSKL
jgi:hypothetical protein